MFSTLDEAMAQPSRIFVAREIKQNFGALFYGHPELFGSTDLPNSFPLLYFYVVSLKVTSSVGVTLKKN